MDEKSSPINKRRSERISRELPIQVSGTDAKGRGFIADTQTQMLSRHGAKFFLKDELVPDQEIVVYCTATSKEAVARVVGLFTKGLEGSSYGIEFVDEKTELWDVPFVIRSE